MGQTSNTSGFMQQPAAQTTGMFGGGQQQFGSTTSTFNQPKQTTGLFGQTTPSTFNATPTTGGKSVSYISFWSTTTTN